MLSDERADLPSSGRKGEGEEVQTCVWIELRPVQGDAVTLGPRGNFGYVSEGFFIFRHNVFRTELVQILNSRSISVCVCVWCGLCVDFNQLRDLKENDWRLEDLC